jgi:methionine synthase II (cobalamin-independent)
MIGNVDRIARLHELEAPKELIAGEADALRQRLDKLSPVDTIAIPANVAIKLIKSIIISLDDEDFAFPADELQAWAELYRKLSEEQRASLETGLHECYGQYYSDGTKRNGALNQLITYVDTGVNCRQRD